MYNFFKIGICCVASLLHSVFCEFNVHHGAAYRAVSTGGIDIMSLHVIFITMSSALKHTVSSLTFICAIIIDRFINFYFQLSVGNLHRHVGYLKYQGWWETGAFIGIMVAVVIVLVIIAAIIIFCCYRRYKDPHYLDMKRGASGNPYVGGMWSDVKNYNLVYNGYPLC